MALDIGQYIPNLGFSKINVINLITILIVFILICILVGFVTWRIVVKKRYNRKIIVFEKIGSTYEPTITDWAMETKIGEGGDTVFATRKTKKYIPTPSLQMGKRTYWFWIREDGEWINFQLPDLDNLSRSVGAKFLDKEMRYARTGLQRNLKERFDKPGFWSVYGGLVAYATLIVLTGVMVWLLFDKYIKISGSLNEVVKSVKEVVELGKDVLQAVDNIKSSSGVVLK